MELKQFIAQLLQEKGQPIQGRIQLQKLVYFCKALGADVNANYKLYIYGPYCQQVADALQDCVVDGILTETNGGIGKGSEFDTFVQYASKSGDVLSGTSREIVHDVLNACSQLTTRQLEITATTFFINRQLKALFGSDDKDEVIKKVTEAKGSRFNEEEISQSYQQVQELFLPIERNYTY